MAWSKQKFLELVFQLFFSQSFSVLGKNNLAKNLTKKFLEEQKSSLDKEVQKKDCKTAKTIGELDNTLDRIDLNQNSSMDLVETGETHDNSIDSKDSKQIETKAVNKKSSQKWHDSIEGIPEEKKALIFLLMQQLKVTKKLVKEAFAVVEKIEGHLEEIDEKIKKHSIEYKFIRISQAELTVIRLSVFELFYEKTLPDKVVFAEAVRLCRKFSTPQGANFVHAVLDSIYKSTTAERPVDKVCCK